MDGALYKAVNEKGGWKIGNDTYKLQSIVYDGGAGDAAKARAAAERLVFQDGVKFMVSNWGEMPNQTATITEPNKVLWLGCDFTDATINPNFKYFFRASGVYFARGLSYVIQKDFVAKGRRPSSPSMQKASPARLEISSGAKRRKWRG